MVTVLLTAVAALLAAAYFWSRHQQGYWQRRGVAVPSGRLPFFGHMLTAMLGRKPMTKHFYDLALEQRSSGCCGIYAWNQPNLLVYDPELVKQIFVKDFSSFHDRTGAPPTDSDPLSQHLFSLQGPKWRNLRNRLSPTFTSGKLKLMFPLMRDIGDQLSSTVAKEVKEAGGELNIQPLLVRFVTDVIGSVAFGINCNCLADENAEFATMSRDLFRPSFRQTLRFLLEAIHPKLGQLLPFKFLFGKVHVFFTDLMKDTVEYREKNKVERNDFVQLMMQLRDQDRGVDTENHLAMTPGVMAAQGFLFFVAGLENVSNTVAYCLHQLVLDQELQQRVADEVLAAIHKHDGQLTYQALNEMQLANRVIMEGLRLWSPIGLLSRKCNETTKVGDVVVEKDTPILVMSDIMHLDPDIFPDPLRFDPERHTAEAKEQRHPYAFLPFGEGPRICIAERLAILEMKLALALIVRDFKLSRGPSFTVEPAKDPKALVPRPLNGFPIVFNVR